jgi:hypothetical protein
MAVAADGAAYPARPSCLPAITTAGVALSYVFSSDIALRVVDGVVAISTMR